MADYKGGGGGGGGGITLPDAVRGVAEVLFEFESSIEVKLVPFNGNRLEINGEVVEIPDAGDICDATSNLIDDGGDLGVPPDPDTLYYAYRSNSAASYAPGELRLSPDAPAYLLDGVKYLSNVDQGLEWRYVGMVYTTDDGGGNANFIDEETDRLVLSAYNRPTKNLFTCPGYVDDATNTQYTAAAGAAPLTKLNGGAGADVRFLSDGADVVDLMAVLNINIGVAFYAGIGIDSDLKVTSVGVNVGGNTTMSARYAATLAAGLHTASIYGLATGADTSVIADLASTFGGAADTQETYLSGFIGAGEGDGGGGGGSGITLPQALVGVAGGRLGRGSAVKLVFAALLDISLAPKYLEIAGELIDLSGVNFLEVDVAGGGVSETVDSSGDPTGNDPAVDTLYYVYATNSQHSDYPEQLVLSTQPPGGALQVGGVYLGGAGNAAVCRYVGQVYLVDDGGGDPEILDTETDRLVFSAYNKVRKGLYVNPGYVDNNAFTSYAFASAVWALAHADFVVRFVTDGADSVKIGAAWLTDAGASIGLNGIAIDGVVLSVGGSDKSNCPDVERALASGLHDASLMAVSGSGFNFFADSGRLGMAADTPVTALFGSVWC